MRRWMMAALATGLIVALTAGSALAGKYHRTFKNDDVVSANDFHGKTVTGKNIVNAGAKHVETGNQAFPDKSGINADSFDWVAGDNLEAIPPGDKLKVCTTGNAGLLGSPDSYLTNNGNPLTTKLVACNMRLSPTDGTSGQLYVSNSQVGNQTVSLSNIQIRVNNTGDVNAVGEFVPDGTIIGGPSSLTLLPGQHTVIAYSGSNAAQAVSISANVALASAPSDLYPQLYAEVPAAAVPGVGTWGLILLTLLLLAGGAFVIRRRLAVGLPIGLGS